MSVAEIEPELLQIFREELNDPTLVLRPDMTQDDVPGWDSAAMVAVIMAAEEQFGFEFSPGELKHIRTVGDVAALIRRHAS